MYGTGQYDYEILQTLKSIDSALSSLSSVVNYISSNWLPIIVGGILVVSVVGLLSWLVKL